MHIDIILWLNLYVLDFVHASFNASWIIFEVWYDIFLFYKIERVIVILVLANNDYV